VGGHRGSHRLASPSSFVSLAAIVFGQPESGIDIPKIMENWITKVGFVTATPFKTESLTPLLIKIGFPVLTVTESKAGIQVRQDRFLESGPADPKENETIWYNAAASSSSLYLNIWIQ
jgi:hypothetical protein